MQVMGWSITRQKAAVGPTTEGLASLSTLSSGGRWWPIVREAFAGAWQRNIESTTEDVLAYTAVYSCVTLIASDIGKLRITLIERDGDGIWVETENPAYSPVLRKPNRYQTRITFLEQWMTSKLIHGNTYVLKERDARGVVVSLYVLDPQRVKVLVAPDGSVFYQLATDNLAGIESAVTVPATEIIHDVMVSFYHPLCGVSPLTACGLAAMHGLRIQRNAISFFENGSTPGGILVAPTTLSEEQARQLGELWERNYGGDNAGRVAVLGNGLEYKSMGVNAVDSQLIEQLKLSGEQVCSAYHVPAYMAGMAPAPAVSNVESLQLQYYSQCLQNPIEKIEVLLDEGIGLSNALGVELDLDGLMRMDTPTRVKAASEAIGGGGMSPNEARRRFHGLGRVKGGDLPYLQQQNYSLEALAKRDAKDDPFASATSDASPAAPTVDPPVKGVDDVSDVALWMAKAYDVHVQAACL